MDANSLAVGVFPHDLFVAINLEQFWCPRIFPAAGITCDDDVAVGQDLTAARILQPRSRKVVVGQLPDDLSIGVEVDNAVSVRAADQRLAVAVMDRREWPRVNLSLCVAGDGRVQLADDLAIDVVIQHREVKQVRNEIRPVGKLASHAGLQMMIRLLTLQRELD